MWCLGRWPLSRRHFSQESCVLTVSWAPLPAVLVNGLVVGAMLAFLFDVGESFGACFLYISAGQAIACYALGIPLSYALERVRWE